MPSIHRGMRVTAVLLAAAVLVAPRSTGVVVSLLPGINTVLVEAPDVADCHRMVFGGSMSVRINRVVTATGVDIEYADASPVDATHFFHDNPLPPSPGTITITVTNQSAAERTLSVRMLPCGGAWNR